MNKKQDIKNKIGEINFRKKLQQQHVEGIHHFDGEYNTEEILPILNSRVDDSKDRFNKLSKKRIDFTPFLELGAERCQSSSYLASNFNVRGFASDISMASLETAAYYAEKLGLEKIPDRICADIDSLPFRSNSLNLVFCNATLHHFPGLKPVMNEIHRVLKPGGYLYFTSEPVKVRLNIPLLRFSFKKTRFEKFLAKIKILDYIALEGKSETQFNILENSFTLKEWLNSIIPLFKISDLQLVSSEYSRLGKLIEKILKRKYTDEVVRRKLIDLLGGSINCLCRANKDNSKIIETDSIMELLMCPDCRNEKPLLIENNRIECPTCGRKFEKKNNILILLPSEIEKLYDS